MQKTWEPRTEGTPKWLKNVRRGFLWQEREAETRVAAGIEEHGRLFFNDAPREEMDASNADLSALKKCRDDVKRRREKLDQHGVVELHGKADYTLPGHLRTLNDKLKKEDAAKYVSRPSAAPGSAASVAKYKAASAASASAPAASATEGKRVPDTFRPCIGCSRTAFGFSSVSRRSFSSSCIKILFSFLEGCISQGCSAHLRRRP